ncbi:MAG: hypothetical protein ACO1Q7_02815 [Gemmatimonas sp.]
MTGINQAPEPDRTARNIGVGCFTFFIGGVSGAMSAVLLGKLYAGFTRAPSCMDMPLCNWYEWAGWGGLLGAVTLPVLVIMRLRQQDAKSDRAASDPSDTSNRG